MIELPPGWLVEFKNARNKADFLRRWADQLYKRARWTQDPERLDELVQALGGALGSALASPSNALSDTAPAEGDIAGTFSGRLWPDPVDGPWLVVLQWQIQGGRLVCVGMELTSAGDAVTTTDDPIAQQLGALGKPLTTTVLRGIRLAQVMREDRAELVEVAEALKAAADTA